MKWPNDRRVVQRLVGAVSGHGGLAGCVAVVRAHVALDALPQIRLRSRRQNGRRPRRLSEVEVGGQVAQLRGVLSDVRT